MASPLPISRPLFASPSTSLSSTDCPSEALVHNSSSPLINWFVNSTNMSANDLCIYMNNLHFSTLALSALAFPADVVVVVVLLCLILRRARDRRSAQRSIPSSSRKRSSPPLAETMFRKRAASFSEAEKRVKPAPERFCTTEPSKGSFPRRGSSGVVAHGSFSSADAGNRAEIERARRAFLSKGSFSNPGAGQLTGRSSPLPPPLPPLNESIKGSLTQLSFQRVRSPLECPLPPKADSSASLAKASFRNGDAATVRVSFKGSVDCLARRRRDEEGVDSEWGSDSCFNESGSERRSRDSPNPTLKEALRSASRNKLHLLVLAISDCSVALSYLTGSLWVNLDRHGTRRIEAFILFRFATQLSLLINRYITVFIACKRAQSLCSFGQANRSLTKSSCKSCIEMSLTLVVMLVVVVVSCVVALRCCESRVFVNVFVWLNNFVTVIVVLVATIFILLRMKFGSMARPDTSTETIEFQRMIVAIAAAFLVCHVPSFVSYSSYDILKTEEIFASFFGLLHSSINLALYLIISSKFRSVLIEGCRREP